MKEIGGYFEIEQSYGEMLYSDGIKFNCARASVLQLVLENDIKRIYMPRYMCNSISDTLSDNQVEISYYEVGEDFRPIITQDVKDEYIYLVNYYGQISNDELKELKHKYKNIIVDNVQAYFQEPLEDCNTVYSCRKFFGVPDGSIIFHAKDVKLSACSKRYEAVDSMRHLFGRLEKDASSYYEDYKDNQLKFKTADICGMSKVSENILRGIDYKLVAERRKANYDTLYNNLKDINKLKLKHIDGPFSYPLLVDDAEELRKELINNRIYIPILWPNVLAECPSTSRSYYLANNIIPLPCDQRYEAHDMDVICDVIFKYYERNRVR
ncbi:MAG: hypothetical protein IJJ74_07375 [Eubacterium sp.]|nr:hypothetical protein [Eubacterium sp.]